MPIDLDKRIENSKFVADYIKHLTTLATGSIVLIATLLEKVFVQPHWKAAVIISLVCFLACILGSAVLFGGLVADSEFWEDGKTWNTPTWFAFVSVLSVFIAGAGFVLGIAFFTAFVVRNLV